MSNTETVEDSNNESDAFVPGVRKRLPIDLFKVNDESNVLSMAPATEAVGRLTVAFAIAAPNRLAR